MIKTNSLAITHNKDVNCRYKETVCSNTLMNEVLYVGVRKDDLNWVKGYYCSEPYQTCLSTKTRHYIIMLNKPMDIGLRFCEVFADSVFMVSGIGDVDGKPIYEGSLITFKGWWTYGSDAYGIVRYGAYEQDGSSGEYSPRDCLGWYVETTSIEPQRWLDDVDLEIPDYLHTVGLLQVAKQCHVTGHIYEAGGRT